MTVPMNCLEYCGLASGPAMFRALNLDLMQMFLYGRITWRGRLSIVTLKKAESLQRALDATVALIIERGSDQLSIAEVAAVARCSTATIYDVYGSKEDLLLEACGRGETIWPRPMVHKNTNKDSFTNLLTYLAERVTYLCSHRCTNLLRATISHPRVDTEAMKKRLQDLDQLSLLAEQTKIAMRCGDIKKSDPDAVAYTILASVSFEPIMINLLLHETVDPPALIRTAMSCHVTEQGRKALDAWFDKASKDGKSWDPLSASYLFGAHNLSEPEDSA